MSRLLCCCCNVDEDDDEVCLRTLSSVGVCFSFLLTQNFVLALHRSVGYLITHKTNALLTPEDRVISLRDVFRLNPLSLIRSDGRCDMM